MKFLNKALSTAALVSTAGIIALSGALPANAAPCLPGFVPTKTAEGNNTCMSRETKKIDPAGISPDAPASFKDQGLRNAQTAPAGPSGTVGQVPAPVGPPIPGAPVVPTIPASPNPLYPEDPKLTESRNLEARASEAAAAPKETQLPSSESEVDRTSAESPIALIIAVIVGVILAAALGTLALLKKRKKDLENPSEKVKPVAKEKTRKATSEPEAIEPVFPEEPPVPLTRREMKERNNITE